MSILTILNDIFRGTEGYFLFFIGIIIGSVLSLLFKIFSKILDNDDVSYKNNCEESNQPQKPEVIFEHNILDQQILFIDSNKILNQLEDSLCSDKGLDFKIKSNSNDFDSSKINKEGLLKNKGEELNRIIVEAQIKYELRKFIQHYIQDKKTIVLEANRLVSGAKDITDEVMDKFILHLDKMDDLK